MRIIRLRSRQACFATSGQDKNLVCPTALKDPSGPKGQFPGLSNPDPWVPIGEAAAKVVFRLRCEARAILVAEGEMDLHDAVDGLQEAAVAYSLVETDQDAVQEIMAEAFGTRS
jgi:hypothetical protein